MGSTTTPMRRLKSVVATALLLLSSAATTWTTTWAVGLLTMTAASSAHPRNPHPPSREMVFPDLPGLFTLTVDLHTHSVFSDGDVWPTIRIQEALRDGLDAISLTEHLEYQPRAADIPHPDRNRAYEIALEAAQGTDLLVIPGSEVTRGMPVGHINAIFVKDSNRLLLDDMEAVVAEAVDQGAYLFWNHPHWVGQQKDGIATPTEFHRRLIASGSLHGIEVVNDLTFSDETLQIALDSKLAIIGASDVHGLVDWRYKVPEGGHRPVTLVFAEERSLDGIHQALLDRRTVAWFDEVLVGEERNLTPLLEASLSAAAGKYLKYGNADTSIASFELSNTSSARLILENVSEFSAQNLPTVVTLEPHESKTFEVRTGKRRESIVVEFKVLSALTAPSTHPSVKLLVPLD